MHSSNYKILAKEVKECTLCTSHLPLGPRPVFQIHPKDKILIAGQAPGSKVHATGIPFDDPSGDRLRDWMGIDKTTFYNLEQIAILPMGFCYPGTGKSGDLPPRKECAEKWRGQMLALMPDIQLTLVIGQYALDWHLKDQKKKNLTETVRAWREYWPEHLPLPHPSPRNNIWLKKNSWFEKEVLPELRNVVAKILQA
ncbi:MAG: uracil-DNA glycosylase family protein [Gammaproteobacteria bacterium]|nr:MAG: uracil-DNA glycosylase family protein [Betaproteobacteria bacterium]